MLLPQLFTASLLAVLLSCSAGEEPSYIMVEVDPVLLQRNIQKRQAQYAEQQQSAGPQYQTQPSPDQITPEYYAYLQQIQSQQPAQLSQLLSSRGPQRFDQQIPPRRPQIPEEVRRLQENFAQLPIRNQEREDQTNQQLIASGLNPSQVRRDRLRQSAERLALQQAQENAAKQALNQQVQQYHQLYSQQQQPAQPQFIHVPQEVQEPAESTPAPERVSYSQIAFGSTKLPQQRLIPGKTQTQQFVYTRPESQPSQQVTYRQPEPSQAQQPHPQEQVVYQPQYVYTTLPQDARAGRPQQVVYTQRESPRSRPEFVYTQQPERLAPNSYQPQRAQAVAYQPQRAQAVAYQPQRVQAVAYQPQRVQALAYHPQRVQAVAYQQPQRPQPERTVSYQPQPVQVQYTHPEVTQKQTPEQYLIETTRPQSEPQQQVIGIPRRHPLSYRPQADFQELEAALTARQQQVHHARQQAEAAASTTPAPRSSIYVTTARTPKGYSLASEYQNRPLTESELNSLINAGFRVSSEQEEQDYPTDQQHYIRGVAKRQNSKPKVGRVPLSEEERQVLAKNGIRNLYRVQSAESQDAPVTYVLAVENQKRDTEKSTSSS